MCTTRHRKFATYSGVGSGFLGFVYTVHSHVWCIGKRVFNIAFANWTQQFAVTSRLFMVKFCWTFVLDTQDFIRARNWNFEKNLVFVYFTVFLQWIHGDCVLYGVTTLTGRKSIMFLIATNMDTNMDTKKVICTRELWKNKFGEKGLSLLRNGSLFEYFCCFPYHSTKVIFRVAQKSGFVPFYSMARLPSVFCYG